jgi:hypothetical protein
MIDHIAMARPGGLAGSGTRASLEIRVLLGIRKNARSNLSLASRIGHLTGREVKWRAAEKGFTPFLSAACFGCGPAARLNLPALRRPPPKSYTGYVFHVQQKLLADAMTRTKRHILWATSVVVAVSIGSCSYISAKYQRAFDKTAIGEAESVVIGRFGKPDARLSSGQQFPAYSSAPCNSPCVMSLWWEAPFPIPRGIEAWAVDFDANGHVVNKWYVLFP